MGHNARKLCHRRNSLVGKVVGIRGSEANPLDSRAGNFMKQLGELRLTIYVATVRVDVLPKKRDLSHAVGHEFLALPHHCLNSAAFFAATHVRNNAIGAEIVASRHDGDPGMELLRTSAGQVAGESTTLLKSVDLNALTGVGKSLL